MPHWSFVRETERSFNPPRMNETTSARRVSGRMNPGCASMWSRSGWANRERRKNTFSSEFQVHGVPWTGHRFSASSSFSV